MLEYLKSKTRVLVTHQLNLLDKVDRVVVMDKGRIVASGTFADLQTQGVNFLSILKSKGEEDKQQQDSKQQQPTNQNHKNTRSADPVTRSSSNLKDRLTSAEEQTVGSVEWATY